VATRHVGEIPPALFRRATPQEELRPEPIVVVDREKKGRMRAAEFLENRAIAGHSKPASAILLREVQPEVASCGKAFVSFLGKAILCFDLLVERGQLATHEVAGGGSQLVQSHWIHSQNLLQMGGNGDRLATLVCNLDRRGRALPVQVSVDDLVIHCDGIANEHGLDEADTVVPQ
jgi:hypothetical protein